MKDKKNLVIKAIAYHRNGVAGEGFHVVTFANKTEGLDDMLAVVFEAKGRIAVLDINLLAKGVIAFTENSWRGD